MIVAFDTSHQEGLKHKRKRIKTLENSSFGYNSDIMRNGMNQED